MPHDDLNAKEGQIPTNLRLLMILEEVARAGVPVKPAAIGKLIGLPKPTVHRLFQTAEAEGFLQRDLDGRAYGPGPRLRDLAVNTMSSQHMRTARLAILKDVAETVEETCNLAAPDREGMVYIDRVETHWPLRIQLPVGTQVPFYCTASGKMYLSSLRPALLEGYLSAGPFEAMTERTITDPIALRRELELTRERGYSIDNEEFMMGMTAMAVPIIDGQGRLMATLSVHVPLPRRSLEDLLTSLPVLKAGAEKLSSLSRG
ncbi:IclR family transcriptional regulator [Roseovarius aestuarii]|uniref:Acetate operon repressor n=1 Tax=Roseovarius aestuarii TaxID=475083 RepID=A0A1X7BLM2_9RHOB|nr:IclR family transcriptional regulator [Roseovarius aestuarii]SMC10440.1 Acetate operon repressor [Roseovarius aestuarii]